MDRLTPTSLRVAGQVDRIRKATELSEHAVADITGIPRTTLRRKLSGKYPFDLDELHILAHLFDVEVLEFFVTVQRRAS